jgi:lipopolysaccharide export system protein LptA
MTIHETPWRKTGAAILLLPLLALPARAQQLDMSQGGPVTVTAQDGIDWHQNDKQVIAHGNARAVRGNVTVDADRLIAYYRKKTDPHAPAGAAKPDTPPAPAAAATAGKPGTAATPAADEENGGTEIYRLAAEGHVHIFTPTDQAWGDRAVYDMDQAVMVLTGGDLKLLTPNELMTARDAMEYYPQQHMAVARGNAVVVTKDAKRMAADTLVAYTTPDPPPPPAAPGGGATQVAAKTPEPAKTDPAKPGDDDSAAVSGKLKKVDAFGHVSVRTATDTVTGDKAVYVPDTGIARIFGNVRITRGENQMNGSEAEVNQKTGISRLLSGGPSERVQGLVMPNDANGPNSSGQPPKSGEAPKPGEAKASPKPTATP